MGIACNFADYFNFLYHLYRLHHLSNWDYLNSFFPVRLSVCLVGIVFLAGTDCSHGNICPVWTVWIFSLAGTISLILRLGPFISLGLFVYLWSFFFIGIVNAVEAVCFLVTVYPIWTIFTVRRAIIPIVACICKSLVAFLG